MEKRNKPKIKKEKGSIRKEPETNLREGKAVREGSVKGGLQVILKT